MLNRAKSGAEHLYFLDASHFVMGALNFVTKKVETVVNSTYITSSEIVDMLEKLAKIHIGAVINVVLDNARYQRCALVRERAAALKINLIYLPTYSPNLNLIERVWKLVKSRVLNAAYHDTFKYFSAKIENLIGSLHTDLLSDMTSLISERFHIIDEKHVV